jgi:surface protein
MILTKSPRVVLLSLYLMMTAGSYFKPVVASAVTPFETNADLKTAVEQYCNGTFVSSSVYGSIEEWDVSKITSMLELFRGQDTCNPDISQWNTSSVTNFRYVFGYAPSFNQDVSNWDVSSGTNFFSAFAGATIFNHDLSNWDVSSGIDFRFMFWRAHKFNQDISNWDVSKAIDFRSMFYHAYAFNQDISSWDVSLVTDFDGVFEGATSFNQPLLHCTWERRNPLVGWGSRTINMCLNTVTCGYGDTCPPTAPPTQSPTPAPSKAPSSAPSTSSAPTSLAVQRSWDMNFLTNATILNVANSLDAELSQSYNISTNRAFGVKYYRNDCKTELIHSISEQSDVSSDGGMTPGFLKLESTAILNSTEVFYDDRDDIYTGDSGGGYVALCIRADLFLSDGMSMNFLEKRVNITVNLETASFSIDEIDTDRTDATDNAPVGLDYSNYVKAYQCDPSDVGNEDYAGTYVQGSVLNVCVKSNDPQVIDINTITNMLVEQDVDDEAASGKKFQYISDGAYNSAIANIDCDTNSSSPKVCIGELNLMGMFFEEANPPNLKVSGDVTLSTDSSIGGENSQRLLRGTLEVIPLEPFDEKQSSGGDGTRVLVSDETGSFDIDVALDSSKMSISTTSKAVKAAFTTMSSIASGVIAGGISLFLFV